MNREPQLTNRRIALSIASVLLLVTTTCGTAQTTPSTLLPTDPVAVVRAFYEALNAGNADVATNYFADDATLRADQTYTGKEQIHGWIQLQINQKTHSEQVNLQVIGDKVIFMAKISRGGDRAFDRVAEVVVRDGKIQSLITE